MPVHGGTGGESHIDGVDRIDGVWRAGWPNPADLNFDFYTLLKGDTDRPIAVVSKQAAAKRIAVIGNWSPIASLVSEAAMGEGRSPGELSERLVGVPT
jgi:hypothetical protein